MKNNYKKSSKNRKAVKFVGPTKKMMDALEEEGLNITWPTEIGEEEDLCIEGTFYTGSGDWEKLVNIDLRGYGINGLTTKRAVDGAVWKQLREASDSFDVTEEVSINLEGSSEERNARGVPDAVSLVEDIKEQESRLERFAAVAECVANGCAIPAPRDEEKVVEIDKDVLSTAIVYLKDYNELHQKVNGFPLLGVEGVVKAISKTIEG